MIRHGRDAPCRQAEARSHAQRLDDGLVERTWCLFDPAWGKTHNRGLDTACQFHVEDSEHVHLVRQYFQASVKTVAFKKSFGLGYRLLLGG